MRKSLTKVKQKLCHFMFQPEFCFSSFAHYPLVFILHKDVPVLFIYIYQKQDYACFCFVVVVVVVFLKELVFSYLN